MADVGIHALVDEGLGNAAWLVDLGDRRGLVVDPGRHPAPYLEAARARRLRLSDALETHLHADFVSGSRELAARGVRVLASRSAGLAFGHRGLADGEEVEVGGLTVRALATPGHTPEHLAWLLLDGGRPVALFSGGALLASGTVARTDLISPEQTGPLTRAAYRSARRLLELPDDLVVYPTHGAGSFCTVDSGGQRTTTIGAERARGGPLASMDAERFASRLLGSLGGYPPYFLRLREVNRRGARLLDERAQTLRKLTVEEVLAASSAGTALIDARSISAYAAGHPTGALSIHLRPQFGTWLGWLLSDTQPLAFLLDDDQDRGELARQCHAIGYERLIGELDGGFEAWQEAGQPVSHVELVDPGDLGERPGPVLDVRQASETAAGHLPGALLVELGTLGRGAGNEDLPAGPLTVMCGHGERAMTAASLLERGGHGDLRVLLGGADDWQRASGQPLVRR